MICMGKIYLYFNSHLTYNYIMMTTMNDTMNDQSLIFRLRKRAEIRRQIASRKSVQEGKPDRIADLLEEAAQEIENLEHQLTVTEGKVKYWQDLAVANRSVAEAAQVRAEIALKEVTRLQEVMQYCCRDKSGEEID